MNNVKIKSIIGFAVMSTVLVVVFISALLFGSTYIPPAEALAALFDTESSASVIMRHVRLPRVLAGLAAGMGLSISGVLLQAVTDNRLASPNIIGVNSGAGLAVIITMSLFPTAVSQLPFAAFFGALVAVTVILFAARRIGGSMRSKTAVILAGMAMTTVLNALISFVSLIDTDVVASYNFFSVGGLSGVDIEMLIVPSLFIATSFAVSFFIAQKISLLCLGDELARSLGVRASLLRTVCIICAGACAAAVVSFAGLLGFVGLIVPNMAKRLVGENVRACLVASSLLGGSIVILADTLGRTLFAPTEIPVGIVMALVGAPFFMFLLMKRRDGDA